MNTRDTKYNDGGTVHYACVCIHRQQTNKSTTHRRRTSRHNTPLTFSRQQRRGPRGSLLPSCSVAIRKALVLGARTIGREVRYTT